MDKATLIRQIQAGQQPKYLMFWGHKRKQPNSMDRSCLSQWFPAAFHLDGHHYPTAEHDMMAGKARLFDDAEVHQAILAAKHPNEAKKLGRKVKNFDADIWQQHRMEIVVAGNLAKFGQHPPLRDFLLSTGDRVLVEASPVDRIWGVGLAVRHDDIEHPERWPGLNLLGFALMEVRHKLRDGSI